MADVREILARLNPQTIKFDVGRGGIAELTNQDVAAALAFVPAGLGRELLEACWWPDGAALRRHKLRDVVIALVEPELSRQQRRLAEARTELGLAQVCMWWTGSVTAQQRENKDRAEQRLEQLKAQCWPVSTLESLPTLAYAVIQEIATKPHCAACEGRGELISGELLVSCKACAGLGVVAISDRRRAAAIGRDESTYRSKWRGVYEWMLGKMREAEQDAAWHLRMALERDAA